MIIAGNNNVIIKELKRFLHYFLDKKLESSQVLLWSCVACLKEGITIC
jgi:hypothetical protein